MWSLKSVITCLASSFYDRLGFVGTYLLRIRIKMFLAKIGEAMRYYWCTRSCFVQFIDDEAHTDRN